MFFSMTKPLFLKLLLAVSKWMGTSSIFDAKRLLTYLIVVPRSKLDHLFRRTGLLAMSLRPRLLHTLVRIM